MAPIAINLYGGDIIRSAKSAPVSVIGIRRNRAVPQVLRGGSGHSPLINLRLYLADRWMHDCRAYRAGRVKALDQLTVRVGNSPSMIRVVHPDRGVMRIPDGDGMVMVIDKKCAVHNHGVVAPARSPSPSTPASIAHPSGVVEVHLKGRTP